MIRLPRGQRFFRETFEGPTFTHHLPAPRSFPLRGAQVPSKRLLQHMRAAAKRTYLNEARAQIKPRELKMELLIALYVSFFTWSTTSYAQLLISCE